VLKPADLAVLKPAALPDQAPAFEPAESQSAPVRLAGEFELLVP
jgi:hypothetical protein